MKKYFDDYGNELFPWIVDGTKTQFIVDNTIGSFPIAGLGLEESFHSDFCKKVVDTVKPIKQVSFLIDSKDNTYQFSTELPVAKDTDGNSIIINYNCNFKHYKGAFYVSSNNSIPLLNSITNNVNTNVYDMPTFGVWQGSDHTGALYIVLAQYGIIMFNTDGKIIGNSYCVIGYYITNKGETIGHKRAFEGQKPVYIGTGVNMSWQGFTLNPIAEEKEFDNSNNTGNAGGYGSGKNPTDNINIPSLPNITITNTGVCLYGLTSTQVQAFTGWLWTSDWQDNIKKIRTDPMQNIIGISLIDYGINGTPSTIQVGNLNTGVNANIVNNWISVDCGSITLEEYYGSFADYEPFIATTLFLPKVGFVQIPADVIINNAVKIVYNIELISGEGLCFVYITDTRNGFSYVYNTYTCHATASIPTSATDHTQQLTALINAGINSTIAIGGAIATGGATSGSAVSTVASSALNVATTKNPTVTRGNFGNFGNILCYKKPYIIINRTNLTKPSSFQENNGYLINYTATINGHTGFLKTRNFHAEFNAPYSHKVEIERILNEGVFIND